MTRDSCEQSTANQIRRGGRSRHRRPRLRALSGLAAAGVIGLTVAACSSSGTTAAPAGTSASAAGTTLATRDLTGVGTVLVDQTGRTVYSPDQEAGGTIHCTGSCLSFWFPVTAGSSGAPTASGALGGVLGTIHRPDGSTQVTYNGKPLYTFRLDQAGQAQGNNFDDSFNGTNFTWHALTTKGTQPISGSGGKTPAPTPSGNGYSGTGPGNGY